MADKDVSTDFLSPVRVPPPVVRDGLCASSEEPDENISDSVNDLMSANPTAGEPIPKARQKAAVLVCVEPSQSPVSPETASHAMIEFQKSPIAEDIDDRHWSGTQRFPSWLGEYSQSMSRFSGLKVVMNIPFRDREKELICPMKH